MGQTDTSSSTTYGFDTEESLAARDERAIAEGRKSPDKVRGRITDEHGNGISGATLIIYTPEEVLGTTVTDSAGRYAMKDLPAGDYDVVIQTPIGRNFALYRVWFATDTYDSESDFQVFLNNPEGIIRAKQRKKRDGMVPDTE